MLVTIGLDTTTLVSLVKVPALHWATLGGSSNILKVGELVLDATPPIDIVVSRYMSIEEVLALLHFYTIEVDGTSLEGHIITFAGY